MTRPPMLQAAHQLCPSFNRTGRLTSDREAPPALVPSRPSPCTPPAAQPRGRSTTPPAGVVSSLPAHHAHPSKTHMVIDSCDELSSRVVGWVDDRLHLSRLLRGGEDGGKAVGEGGEAAAGVLAGVREWVERSSVRVCSTLEAVQEDEQKEFRGNCHRLMTWRGSCGKGWAQRGRRAENAAGVLC